MLSPSLENDSGASHEIPDCLRNENISSGRFLGHPGRNVNGDALDSILSHHAFTSVQSDAQIKAEARDLCL